MKALLEIKSHRLPTYILAGTRREREGWGEMLHCHLPPRVHWARRRDVCSCQNWAGKGEIAAFRVWGQGCETP